MSDLKVEYLKIDDLTPYKNNSRTHPEEQIQQVTASIKEFGFTNPLLIDEKNEIIAGHCRLLAAKSLGMPTVPCLRFAGLSKAQKRAYIIADNKLALNAGWDEELLSLELNALNADGFDMALLGFDAGELSTAMGLDGGLDAGVDEGIGYKENFSIIVTCADEANQRQTFEKLTGMGFECKVLVN